MTEKILPTPEKFASCPYDGKILEFYAGQFESVFIILHPFMEPADIEEERFCPEKWPSKIEIIEGCKPISWKQVLTLTGLTKLADVDVGLRTIIGGLRKDLSNHEFSEKLIELDNAGIILPEEGDIPPLLENRILEAIKALGHDWLWVGDEFGTERKLHFIDDLIAGDEIPIHGCIFTHDHSLLVTTHWDSHCSFLCSSKSTLETLLEAEPFEGFFCSENTEVYWGAYEI